MTKYLSTLLLNGLVVGNLSAYEMHEWGTFTTVSGSNGKFLTGLHIEEERLPPFVYSHAGMQNQNFTHFAQLRNAARSINSATPSGQLLVRKSSNGKLTQHYTKGLHRANISNVTVKMETPVIYFYSDKGEKVNVKVGFNGGTISQWYPQRKSGDTPNKVDISNNKLSPELEKSRGNSELVLANQAIDFSKPYDGSIEWDVEVLPKDKSDPALSFKQDQTPSWIYPRVADANMLKVGDEYEDYLFYRGIGNFELPATFTVDSSETLKVTNNCQQAIPFAFAFENIAGKFRYKTIGSIAPSATGSVTEKQWIIPKNQQVEVFQEMRNGLVAQGLTRDEANGMVKTWWKSYFDKPGLRVFWVLPQQPLDSILPLELTPAPQKSVRVIVGRADILRPRFEQKMLQALGTKAFSQFQQNRFFLPFKNRLEQIITKPVFTKFTEDEITNINLPVTASKGKSELGTSFQLRADSKVEMQHLKLNGSWEITSENKLKIGDMTFTLDPKTGTLTAPASESILALEPNYTTYRIQLPKVLN